jgi:hypothetical protein
MLCCDATVVPIVMNGAGQPLDVGRATRTIPDGLRRAVAARDRGLPEFIPPRFVDPDRTPRRKALPHLAGLCP